MVLQLVESLPTFEVEALHIMTCMNFTTSNVFVPFMVYQLCVGIEVEEGLKNSKRLLFKDL